MAVYRRTYSRYAGELTKEFWRFTIIPRYALRTTFEGKFNIIAFIVALVPHLIALLLIYFRSNLDALIELDAGSGTALSLISVDGNFFLTLFAVETVISFFMVALMGPGLIAPDLANNALPLYLSRPFSRAEYVLGKLSVLLVMTSLITWVPGVLLIVVQTSFAGLPWISDHVRLLMGVVIGSWIWILTISLMSLALSAWVRWKPVAAAALFGIFFVGAGFGTISNVILGIRWGTLLNMASIMRMVWRWLLFGESSYRMTMPPFETLPAWTGLASMAVLCLIALALLRKKVAATQVVR